MTAAIIVESAITPLLAKYLPDSCSTGSKQPSSQKTWPQCGFRANRVTTDIVFVLRQLLDKFQQQNKGRYATFVDLTEAFDLVSRIGLWPILKQLGNSQIYIRMVIMHNDNQHEWITLNGELIQPFPITNREKHRCVLAPAFLSIFFWMMFKQVIKIWTMKVGCMLGTYIYIKRSSCAKRSNDSIKVRLWSRCNRFHRLIDCKNVVNNVLVQSQCSCLSTAPPKCWLKKAEKYR